MKPSELATRINDLVNEQMGGSEVMQNENTLDESALLAITALSMVMGRQIGAYSLIKCKNYKANPSKLAPVIQTHIDKVIYAEAKNVVDQVEKEMEFIFDDSKKGFSN